MKTKLFVCRVPLLKGSIVTGVGEKERRVLNTSVHINQESDHASEKKKKKKFDIFSAVYC